jgi:predicted  nucleic acid-binding Zn-ribbon protein
LVFLKLKLYKKDFERNDLKSFENEIDSVYKRMETLENMSYKHRQTGASHALRQRLDNLQMETNALRNDSNTYVQKYLLFF